METSIGWVVTCTGRSFTTPRKTNAPTAWMPSEQRTGVTMRRYRAPEGGAPVLGKADVSLTSKAAGATGKVKTFRMLPLVSVDIGITEFQKEGCTGIVKISNGFTNAHLVPKLFHENWLRKVPRVPLPFSETVMSAGLSSEVPLARRQCRPGMTDPLHFLELSNRKRQTLGLWVINVEIGQATGEKGLWTEGEPPPALIAFEPQWPRHVVQVWPLHHPCECTGILPPGF